MSIHPTAVVDPQAEIDSTVEVGPYAIIGPDVKIGAGTEVGAKAYIINQTTIGRYNEIHVGAVIGQPPQHLAYKKGTPTYTVIGDRNIIREYVSIHGSYVNGQKTTIGDGCYFMGFSHVGHDCQVGNRVIMANGSVLGGHVEVEDGVFLSGLVAVHQFVRVGTLVMVAGVARITRDVPPYLLAYGDSEVIGLNTVGLKRAGIGPQARTAIKKAYNTLYQSGRSLPKAIEELKRMEPGPELAHMIEFLEGSERGICGGRRTR
jgi:UDP-N-acetylglucosamine acyltransferase